jgi:hypothetical protein
MKSMLMRAVSSSFEHAVNRSKKQKTANQFSFQESVGFSACRA